MKVYDNLYASLTDFDNLYRAFHSAARDKRSDPAVTAFEYDLERNLLQLERELQDHTYRPGAYYSFTIRDPKRRLVSAAPFRDRVVHHALCAIVEPIFERTFIPDSYANRVRKGTHRALDRAQFFAQRYRYVWQGDLRQFFPSVDHEILRAILARKIADPDVRWLIDQIIHSGAGVLSDEYQLVLFPGDDLFAANRPRGLPIGNLTSQFWANVYLNELDQFVKRQLRCPAYVRYVDDTLSFSNSKRQLWEWKDALRDFLAGLRVTLHERESAVYPVENGIPFLGFCVYPYHRRLRRRNGVAFARRLRGWYAELARGDLLLDELHTRVRGWIAHAEHGNTWGLRRSLFNLPIPRVTA
jgi:retron-type reverse transcriptase